MKKLILLLTISVSLMGQSAYYRLGYGDIFPNKDPLGSALGHGVVAFKDTIYMATQNPAALSNSNRVHFGVGLGSEFKSIDDVVSNTTRLERLFFSFPIGKRFGMSVGTHAVADFASIYAGSFGAGTLHEISSGGIWDLNLGLGYKVSPAMRLGLKLHSFQGQIRRQSLFQTEELSELFVVKGDITGRSIEAGVISDVREKVSLGITVNIPYDRPSVNGRDSLAGSTDYSEFVEEMAAWPTSIRVGVIYHHNRLTNFMAGIEQQIFSESGFEDARIFALPEGWKTVPVASFQLSMQRLPEDRSSRYWIKRTSWQTGLSVKNYYLSPPSGNMLSEYSLISGARLELRNGRSLFEVSGEVGKRSGDESLPDELFARMKFGIQINDIWFRKVKRR